MYKGVQSEVLNVESQDCQRRKGCMSGLVRNSHCGSSTAGAILYLSFNCAA